MTNAEKFMRQAVDLARKAEGRTAPNPPVGAVLVRDGEVVGEGFHPAAGQPHAEIFALRQAGPLARGATLYVTLEPCCHHGRTGPCTAALIEAGVSRVLIGATDPNPGVSGRGSAILQDAGVSVETGVLGQTCRQLIAPFAKHVTSGLPYVLFKAAMTLDGRTATATGDSRWIPCLQSRELVHRLRDRVDGILIGSGTVLADNPRLTTRLAPGGRDPARIVVDSRLVTSSAAKVYSPESAVRRILVTGSHHPEQMLRPFLERGVEVVRGSMRGQHLELGDIMKKLGSSGLLFLMLEGGAGLAGAMLRAGLIDRLMLFIAPRLLGGADGYPLLSGTGVANIEQAWQLTDVQSRQIGSDILIEGEMEYVHRPD